MSYRDFFVQLDKLDRTTPPFLFFKDLLISFCYSVDIQN